MAKTTKTPSEIEDQIDEASLTRFESKFYGMTYEDGVIAALEWVLGIAKEKPMEDDE